VTIALVCEVVPALLRTDFCERVGDRRNECIDRSGGGLSQQSFEFGEELFDRIEVGAIGRQVAQLCTGGFDGFADAGDFVAGEIVHHDNIAVPQDRNDELLDIGTEARTIHRSIEHARCGDLTDTERSNECCRLPVAPRHGRNEALTTRTAAIAARHIGRGARFVDEEKAFRVQVRLARAPLIACLGNVRSILLGGSLRLFLSGSLRNLSLFQRHPMLTLTSRSATSQACNSSSVASG
jgi:hypothetical protein